MDQFVKQRVPSKQRLRAPYGRDLPNVSRCEHRFPRFDHPASLWAVQEPQVQGLDTKVLQSAVEFLQSLLVAMAAI